MANPHGSFIWYELMTTDSDAAQRFYSDVVGWTVSGSGQEGMDYRIFNAPDGSVGGLMKLPGEAEKSGMRPAWNGYISVDDVDATVTKLERAGGRIYMPAQDVSGVGRMAMVTDAQGAPFYVMRPAPPAGNTDATSTAFDRTAKGHIAWNELTTDDPETAFDFYANLFSWDKGEAMDMGAMGRYQMINLGGKSFGAIMKRRPEGPPSKWAFYITIDDIDTALDRVKTGGAEVHYGPTEIPGGDFILIASDPQGALFALVGPRKSN